MDLVIALKALGMLVFAGALWLVVAAVVIELVFRYAQPLAAPRVARSSAHPGAANTPRRAAS